MLEVFLLANLIAHPNKNSLQEAYRLFAYTFLTGHVTLMAAGYSTG